MHDCVIITRGLLFAYACTLPKALPLKTILDHHMICDDLMENARRNPVPLQRLTVDFLKARFRFRLVRCSFGTRD